MPDELYNPIIDEGQLAFDRTVKTMSVGDGVTHWIDLPKIGVPYPPNDDKVYVMVNGQWAILDISNVNILIPPVITSALDVTVELGQNLTYVITANNADDATYTATNLPSGATYTDSTHTITWDVSADADWTVIHSVNLSVANDAGTDQQVLNIVLTVPESWKPKITPNQVISVVAGEEMTPYQILGQNITVTDV